MYNLLKSLKKIKGQAVTEFAVTLPVLVFLFLFSQYFFEAYHVKLKNQEMARYVAWEFTGYALHDYKKGRTDPMFSRAQGEINREAMKRFQDLNSSTPTGNVDRLFMGKWTIEDVKIENLQEPPMPGGNISSTLSTIVNGVILGSALGTLKGHGSNYIWLATAGIYASQLGTLFGGSGLSQFTPLDEWRLNKKGYVQVKVKTKFENLFVPEKYSRFMNLDFSDVLKPIEFEETVVVLADSWKVQYGEDINGTKDKSKAYYKQVDRMAFFNSTARKFIGINGNLIKWGTNMLAYMTLRGTLGMRKIDETALVAKNYQGGPGGATSGRIAIEEDHGKVEYDTLPLMTSGRYGSAAEPLNHSKAEGKNSYYEDVRVQRGENYMGCHEQESLGCTSSLSNDNPFGDYIIPKPDY